MTPSTAGTSPSVDKLRHGEYADPAERDEDERGQPGRCVDPEEIEHEARSGAGQTTTKIASASLPSKASNAKGVYVPAIRRRIVE